jgi:hypothetical protein
MANTNYNDFNRFDLNEACDHFDCEKQTNWKKINKFVVADGAEYGAVMVDGFDFDQEDANNQYEAFDAGVRYALTRMQAAFEAAGLELEIKEADLGESMGYMLTRVDDEPEDFVKRVLKKPVLMVDSWV